MQAHLLHRVVHGFLQDDSIDEVHNNKRKYSGFYVHILVVVVVV